LNSTTAPPASGYQAQPARSPEDEALRSVFTGAKKFTDRVAQALQPWRGPEFPDGTLHKLEIASRIDYAAACSLLYEDWLSYGAYIHVRGLAENAARAAWILGKGLDSIVGSAESRARCYELAMAATLDEEVRFSAESAAKLSLTGPGAETIAASAAVLNDLRSEHTLDTCDCQGNGRRHAEPLIKQLASAKPENRLRIMDDILIVWRHTSRVGHHVGIERMLRSDGTRVWIGPAESWQRVQIFISALTLYGALVGWCAERFDAASGIQLMKEFGELTHAKVLLDIAGRHPDQFRPANR
jgi:hypothetical protein